MTFEELCSQKIPRAVRKVLSKQILIASVTNVTNSCHVCTSVVPTFELCETVVYISGA